MQCLLLYCYDIEEQLSEAKNRILLLPPTIQSTFFPLHSLTIIFFLGFGQSHCSVIILLADFSVPCIFFKMILRSFIMNSIEIRKLKYNILYRKETFI